MHRLELDKVKVTYGRHEQLVVGGVDLHVDAGEILGLVGESGSGKSTLAKAVVGAIQPASGSIRLDGKDLPPRRPPQLRRKVQLVHQDPGSTLDPRLSIASTLAEALPRLPADERHRQVALLLQRVGLPLAIADLRPANLSGGQRQRVAIARALAAEPRVLVADEIVTALDVSAAGAVLNVLVDLSHSLDMATLFISHHLGVVAAISDRVAVMYRGEIVEVGSTADVFERPRHHYTQRLLAAVPRLDRTPPDRMRTTIR